MKISRFLAALALSMMAAALLVAPGCSDDGATSNDAGADATTDQRSSESGTEPDTGPAPGAEGAPCTNDSDCDSSICFHETCARACTSTGDCDSEQVCDTDDGARLLCRAPSYPADIGTSCALTGSCSGAADECLGKEGTAGSYCSIACSSEQDCPPDYRCREISETESYCAKRSFCTRCLHDGMCPSGYACIAQGDESFCAKPCTPGSTECPRYAECKPAADGHYCHHKAGTCAGDGDVCDPCSEKGDCDGDAYCVYFPTDRNSFCTKNCANYACDQAGYECSPFEGTEQCVPTAPNAETPPSCVPLSPMMEEGDIMDDFAMVGYEVGSDASGAQEISELKVVRLSDYGKMNKVILFNISAGWCGPCQSETQQFKNILDTYGPKGLVIFQTLFDADKMGDEPTLALLDAWVTQLDARGVIGIDPARVSVPYNAGGTTPLNMVIDAKTREVLAKFNGFSASDLAAVLDPLLGN
jgi:thiol-disulfide isomerase/thioredoxin